MSKGKHGHCLICGSRLRNYYRRSGDAIFRGLLCSADPRHREEARELKKVAGA